MDSRGMLRQVAEDRTQEPLQMPVVGIGVKMWSVGFSQEI